MSRAALRVSLAMVAGWSQLACTPTRIASLCNPEIYLSSRSVVVGECANLKNAVARINGQRLTQIEAGGRRERWLTAAVQVDGWPTPCSAPQWSFTELPPGPVRLTIADESGELLYEGPQLLDVRQLEATAHGVVLPRQHERREPVQIAAASEVTVALSTSTDRIVSSQVTMGREGTTSFEVASRAEGHRMVFVVPAELRGTYWTLIQVEFAREARCEGVEGLTCSAHGEPCYDCRPDSEMSHLRLEVVP